MICNENVPLKSKEHFLYLVERKEEFMSKVTSMKSMKSVNHLMMQIAHEICKGEDSEKYTSPEPLDELIRYSHNLFGKKMMDIAYNHVKSDRMNIVLHQWYKKNGVDVRYLYGVFAMGDKDVAKRIISSLVPDLTDDQINNYIDMVRNPFCILYFEHPKHLITKSKPSYAYLRCVGDGNSRFLFQFDNITQYKFNIVGVFEFMERFSKKYNELSDKWWNGLTAAMQALNKRNESSKFMVYDIIEELEKHSSLIGCGLSKFDENPEVYKAVMEGDVLERNYVHKSIRTIENASWCGSVIRSTLYEPTQQRGYGASEWYKPMMLTTNDHTSSILTYENLNSLKTYDVAVLIHHILGKNADVGSVYSRSYKSNFIIKLKKLGSTQSLESYINGIEDLCVGMLSDGIPDILLQSTDNFYVPQNLNPVESLDISRNLIPKFMGIPSTVTSKDYRTFIGYGDDKHDPNAIKKSIDKYFHVVTSQISFSLSELYILGGGKRTYIQDNANEGVVTEMIKNITNRINFIWSEKKLK